jgi:methylglutaconyl-CoA hydratase
MPERGAPSSLAGGRLLRTDCDGLREIRLHRPDVRNALDEELIRGLTEVFEETAREVANIRADAAPGSVSAPAGPGDPTDAAPRAILLSAEGSSFCAGADLAYMSRVSGFSEAENVADARRLSEMFRAIRGCPVFVIGRVQGFALGGGAGLVACCDLAIASEESRFGFTEVRLGIVPAVISPFVIERIGPARARSLFPTGEIIQAEEARRIGLVDRVVPAGELDAAVQAVVEAIRAAAPLASREAKALVDRVSRWPAGEAPALHEETARLIARLRALPEGREGMAAFLEKRKARWIE